MRTLSGKVGSSNPINLSKAAKIMSGFAAVDNGASDAVLMYLRRSSDAFNSLIKLHKKELKTPFFRRRLHASQPIVSAVKTDTLANCVENPKGKKVQKGKKNRDLEPFRLATVQVEEKKKQDFEFGSNNEDAKVIDQGPNGFSGKKRKKTDKKERKLNKESMSIVQCSDRFADVQALEAADECVQMEKIEYEGAKKEFDGLTGSEGGGKRNKKKRKRNEGEERKKSSEVEDLKTE